MSPLLPRREAGRAGLSRGAREYRQLMWLMVAMGAAGFLLGIAGLRGRAAPSLAPLGFFVGVATLAVAAWFGLRVRSQTLADREREASGALTVLLAAQLRDRDDATLQGIVAKGGPAGEAARLVLEGRKERRRQA
jgi:hypothetical protein